MTTQDRLKDYKGSTMRERMMYGIGDAGGALLMSFPGAYLTLYCTDSLQISAAFLGTMFLICRIFDGLSDILMGLLIDRTSTKLGKARPWFIASILPLVVSFILLFNVPASLSTSQKMVFIYIVYILQTVVFYTMNNIAYHSMLQRFALTVEDRGKVSSVRALLAQLFAAGLNIVVPIAIPMLGGEASQRTWTVIAAVIGIFSMICLVITGAGIREKLQSSVTTLTEAEKAERSKNNKVALGYLLKSKYFYISIFVSFVAMASINMFGIAFYYARDIMGRAEMTSLLVMAGMLPSVLALPFIPMLYQKFGRRIVIPAGLVLGAVASLIIMINPSSLPLNMICLVIRCICGAPLLAGAATLPGDVTDLCEKVTGVRAEGITTASQSIGGKIGTGIGGAFVAWGLAIGGYDVMLPVQSDFTKFCIAFVFCVIPALVNLFGAALTYSWDIEKKLQA